MKFVVRRNKGGEFFYQIVGSNGEVMAHSEGMSRKESCLSSIESIKKNAVEAQVDDRSSEA